MWQKGHQIRWQFEWVTKKSDRIFTKNCDKFGASDLVTNYVTKRSPNKVTILVSHQKEWYNVHQKLWQIWCLTKCVTNIVTILITKFSESPNLSPNVSPNLSPNTLGLLYEFLRRRTDKDDNVFRGFLTLTTVALRERFKKKN